MSRSRLVLALALQASAALALLLVGRSPGSASAPAPDLAPVPSASAPASPTAAPIRPGLAVDRSDGRPIASRRPRSAPAAGSASSPPIESPASMEPWGGQRSAAAGEVLSLQIAGAEDRLQLRRLLRQIAALDDPGSDVEVALLARADRATDPALQLEIYLAIADLAAALRLSDALRAERLRAHLEDDLSAAAPGQRAAAVAALGRLGDPASRGPLTALADDPDPVVRQAVEAAVVHLERLARDG